MKTETPITLSDTAGRTRWTDFKKLHTDDEAKALRALSVLVERYEPLILWYIRKSGINPNECQDVCQDYLVKEFIKDVVHTADPSKGRFRTFLFHTLSQFIASEWRKQHAQKRGKGRVVSYDAIDPDRDFLEGLADRASIHQLQFEIEMGLCLHDEVVRQLRQSYSSREQEATFDALLPHLFEINSETYTAVPDRLESHPETVRQNLSRLRKRYAEVLVQRIRDQALNADNDPKAEAKEFLKLIGAGLAQRAGTRSAKAS
ncbi:MAG: sigma factor [Verrucomicrobiales bacterium]